MKATVFFSWQSDSPAESGTALIERALNAAILRLATDASLTLRPELDRDTQNVPGAPPMAAAILAKIDLCAVFVADVSLTHARRVGAPRVAPNPNVAFELGYAMKRLGHGRVLLVLDRAYGAPEELPFDLRGHRVVVYDSSSAAQTGNVIEHTLAETLTSELRLIFLEATPPHDSASPLKLEISYKRRKIESHRHDYRLIATLTNAGTEIITDWAVELRIPRILLDPKLTYPIVEGAAERATAVMRWTAAKHSGPIYPGDTREVVGVDYMVDDERYEKHDTLFKRLVQVSVYVGNRLAVRAEKPVEQLQVY
jgi:hypothetical protein